MNKPLFSRKDGIILSAIDIINEMGLQGLSTKELAKRQGMAESLLYKYFRNKEEVIEAVLEYYSLYDTAIINSIEKKGLTSKEGLIYWAKAYTEYYENYPAITAMVNLYEVLNQEDSISKRMRNILKTRSEFLIAQVGKGQAKGELKSLFSARELADLIMGYTNTMILRWRLENYEFSLKESVLSTLDKLLA